MFNIFSTPRKLTEIFLLLLLSFFLQNSVAAKPPSAGIATAHPLATDAGLEILENGGNAFDAAVAITAALAVVEPMGSGLGGGGFWLLHRASDKFETMLDGREKAPQAAHKNMYLDKAGNVIKGASIDGPLAAAIPGIPAAMVHLAKKYGRLPLKQSLAPAIKYAKNGFTIDKHYRSKATFRLNALKQSPAAAKIFLLNGEVPPKRHVIKQTDLATTLEAIASKGHDGFYAGPVAEKLVKGSRAAGGIWALKDLKDYNLVERTPIKGNYKNLSITSAPPPSSGGIALIEMLNILSDFDLTRTPVVTQSHIIIEAMRRAYRDRAQYLGDPDFFTVPVTRLTSKNHASKLGRTISVNKATPSSDLPGVSLQQGGQDTTHFSVIDADGNRVAATLTINYPFGSGFVPQIGRAHV